MAENKNELAPNNTAVRTALWRALHVQIDAAPHIIEDEIGFQLVSPEEGWKERPDMHAEFTKRLRASVVARARFIEDIILEETKLGITQYVLLGAGLDTFAQRQQAIAAQLQIFEIDQPDTLAWKQQRLKELRLPMPASLHFVPVDFETTSWWQQLLNAGFDINKPAVFTCTGVTLYLTQAAIRAMLKQICLLAPGSKVAIAFYLPINLLDDQDKFLQEIAEKGAREAATPFVSFFSPAEIVAMGYDAGFSEVRIVSVNDLTAQYFADRTDGLIPASGEVFLVATT